jgi:transcriptional regulator with XRE-family HTH domain
MVTRIRKLLEHKQLTPTQFADLIGVGRPVMSHILSERNKPSLEVVQRIISAFPELSLPWLLNGSGEMLATAETAPLVAPPAPVLTPEPSPLPAPTLPAAQEPAATPASLAPEAPVAMPASASPEAPAATTASPAPETPVALATEPTLEVAPPAAPLAVTPEASLEASTPQPVTPRPFRAVRFVPGQAQQAQTAPIVQPAPQVAQATPLATAAIVLPTPPVAEPELAPVMPAATEPTLGAMTVTSSEAALLPFMAEPGKAIRRIVIFYRDGSFADYQPEQ